MTSDQIEAIRSYLYSQRDGINQQIVTLESFRDSIDWLVRQLPKPAVEEAPKATPANGHIAWADSAMDTTLAYLAGQGAKGIKATDLAALMQANNIQVKSSYVSQILTKAKAQKRVRNLSDHRWVVING